MAEDSVFSQKFINNNAIYVEVVLPLPLQATFTYRVPAELNHDVKIGQRVVVPFGRKKFYTAIVVGYSSAIAVEKFEIKDVAMIIDNDAIIRHPQLKLWNWIADYYLSSVGDVYKAAVPAGLKIESETFVEINPDFEMADLQQTSHKNIEIIQLLDHEGALTLSEIQRKTNLTGITARINHMIEDGILIVSEKLVERYRPKRISMVTFAIDKDALPQAFNAVKGAQKQERLLMAMLELSGFQRGNNNEVSRDSLLEKAEVSPAILNAVVKKGILRIYKKEINRFDFNGEITGKLPTLSPQQSRALDEIHKSWLTKDVSLLHGVTASGKTEIYLHLIDYVLRQGRQALYLVPEIALTTQLTARLQKVFGNKVVIYHSKFSDNERVDIWNKLLHTDEPLVIIGARSAIFLPFSSLGLVIVDEEHEQSYKQFEPAPRYNARDAAMVLARMHGGKTLLGSATPSIETYYKALNGKFGLIKLTERYAEALLPEIVIEDLGHARKTGTINGVFAISTINAVREALKRGNQAILFQNRRGYAPLARCKQCAYVPRCQHCDVALTYHNHLRQLQCHYCGATYPLPNVCPQCHEPAIEIIGYGTERVEEEVETIFKDSRMMRMDLDTTRNKDSYLNIIDDFSNGKANILVGTQMVTKGLDFGGVEVVAVLNADAIIDYPDFRSAERAFNMLEQVSGRAGRRANQSGKVIVQTYRPQHPILSFVMRHDYLGFYEHEIAERQRYFYPPFTRIIYIYLKHRDPSNLRLLAQQYADMLRVALGNRVFGPEEPGISRIQGLYIRKIMLKVEVNASISQIKTILRKIYETFLSRPEAKGTTLFYDVDPI